MDATDVSKARRGSQSYRGSKGAKLRKRFETTKVLWTSYRQARRTCSGSTIVPAHAAKGGAKPRAHQKDPSVCRRAPGVRALPHRTAKVVHYDSRVHFNAGDLSRAMYIIEHGRAAAPPERW